ncbi:protein FAR1-related sequence 5 [Tanacetum coccineum]
MPWFTVTPIERTKKRRISDEVFKLKNFKKDALFKLSSQRSGFMDPSHSSALSSASQNSHVVSLNALTEEIVAYEKEIDDTHAVKNLDALSTPESFVTHSNFDTPGGTVYYIPKVSAAVLLVKGNVYDSVDDCVVAYMKYAAEAGFVVRRSCQKRMLNGDVRQKYLVCNRMGCPKGIHVDTLDLGNSDKQKRNSNLHITGCKARAVFNLDTCTRKFVLKVFDTIHNHELEREEYKHLSKTERQLTYMEQAFIVKAASVNIGATRAYPPSNGDSDARCLFIRWRIERSMHLNLFDYLVDECRTYAIFGPDEVCKNNSGKVWRCCMFDVPLRQTIHDVVCSVLQPIDITGCVLRFWKALVIVSPGGPDGANEECYEAEFGGSKHQSMHVEITQKLLLETLHYVECEDNIRTAIEKMQRLMYKKEWGS